MATWMDMAKDSKAAASELAQRRRYRSAVSRSYYAAYAAATDRLVSQGLTSFGRFHNPSHADLPVLVARNLSSLSHHHRAKAANLLRQLRLLREDADYRPSRLVDRSDDVQASRCLATAWKLLGGAT